MLELVFLVLIIVVVIGVLLGLFVGLYLCYLVLCLFMMGSVVGFLLLMFWVGLMLIMVFSVSLGWLFVSGCGEMVCFFGIEWLWLMVDGLWYFVLLVVNLLLFKFLLVL